MDFEILKKRVLPFFIEYYGEEYQAIIEERLSKVVPLFYTSIDARERMMHLKQKCKKGELTLEFLEKNGIKVSDEIKKDLINGYTYQLSDIPEVASLLNKYFGSLTYEYGNAINVYNISRVALEDDYLLEKAVMALNNFGINCEKSYYNEWLKSEEALELFKEIDFELNIIKGLDRKYEEFNKKFSSLEIECVQASKIKEELRQKYLWDYLTAIRNYLSPRDQNLVDNRKKSYMLEVTNLVGDIGYNGLISSMGRESLRKIADENESSWIIEGIKEKQSIFRRKVKSYPSLANLTQDEIDNLIILKHEYDKKFTEEYLYKTSNLKVLEDQIKAMNLATDIDMNMETFETNLICISIGYSRDDKLIPFLVFSPEYCLSNYADVSFIHELNHAIELSLIDYKARISKTGWDIVDDKLSDNVRRPYELISEGINQLIAIDITKSMHNHGVFLFDNPKTAEEKGGTSYEEFAWLVAPMLEKYHDEVIASRIGSSMQPLLDIIGQEAFLKLNFLIKRFTELPYHKMLEDLRNNRNTELVAIRSDIINSAKEIYSKIASKKI